MKTIKLLITGLYLISIITLSTNCSKSSAAIACNKNEAFSTKFKSSLDAVTKAAIDYATTPNAANCATYKRAYTDYIDDLEDYESCARESGTLSDWQNAINDARQDVKGLGC